MNRLSDTVLLSTTYFGPVQYYCKLISYKNIYIEKFEHYSKQSFRNRCNIVSANGVLSLSIPVQKTDNMKMLTKDVQIDYHTRWPQIHWRAIESAYKSSPFFMYYADDIEPFYNQQFNSLIDFNSQLQQTIIELIGCNINISYTEGYKTIAADFDDFADTIHPKINKSQPDNTFVFEKYYQVFERKHGFKENMSILDLLFNMGPAALDVLQKSIKY